MLLSDGVIEDPVLKVSPFFDKGDGEVLRFEGAGGKKAAASKHVRLCDHFFILEGCVFETSSCGEGDAVGGEEAETFIEDFFRADRPRGSGESIIVVEGGFDLR